MLTIEIRAVEKTIVFHYKGLLINEPFRFSYREKKGETYFRIRSLASGGFDFEEIPLSQIFRVSGGTYATVEALVSVLSIYSSK